MPFVAKHRVRPASPPLWSMLVFWATAKAAVVAEVGSRRGRSPLPTFKGMFIFHLRIRTDR